MMWTRRYELQEARDRLKENVTAGIMPIVIWLERR